MAELLDALAVQGDVRCSLVTGNYEPVARLKLERAGHRPPFRPRPGRRSAPTPSTATSCRRSPRRAPAGIPRDRTIVIGDTPLDIACARADGLRVLAVATGLYTVDELADADAVVDRRLRAGRAARAASAIARLSGRAACR